MSERTLRLTAAALAVVGAAVSAYLLYVRQTGGTLICSTGGCETVQSSSYAEVLGLPVAALGLAGFLGLIAAALARGEGARMAQATLALAGFIFSAYLLYIQLAVVDAICQWCLVTDALVTAIAVLALLRLRFGSERVAAPPPVPARPYPRRRTSRERSRKRRPRARSS